MERLYTVKELAEANWFPKKERTIRNMVYFGQLRSYQAEGKGNHIRIPESAVKEYLKSIEK